MAHILKIDGAGARVLTYIVENIQLQLMRLFAIISKVVTPIYLII